MSDKCLTSDNLRHMSQTTPIDDDPLAGWDPRRRAALLELWQHFKEAGASGTSLSDELIRERREAAAAEDHL